MKKEIRTVDKDRGIVQITSVDERWYVRNETNSVTGLPSYLFVPSVTWMAGHYPKGIEFYKWLAGKGWDESQAIKQAAGDKGSKIHLAIGDLHAGNTVRIDSPHLNKSTGFAEDLTAEEYEAILSYAEWFEKTKPEVLGFEYVVWNTEHGYAGTVDLKCRIDGEIWLIDVKSSAHIWPEYEIQVSAYRHADSEADIQRLGILQVGYKRNKNQKYKLTEITDKFPLFLAAKQIWANECEGVAPLQKDYPLLVTLSLDGDGLAISSVSAAAETEGKPSPASVRNARKPRVGEPTRAGKHSESLS